MPQDVPVSIPTPGDRDLRQAIPIRECGEPCVPLPESVARVSPHPYAALGAPYGDRGPYVLRVGAAERLARAQTHLTARCPGYRLQVHDAYRPLSVQAFMIDYETKRVRAADPALTSPAARAAVLRLWARPDPDPTRPPPHSTGAAVDVTILDDRGRALSMGCPVDHVGPEAAPDYLATRGDAAARAAHGHRELLYRILREAGFHRVPHEWWHFSYGDQWWALLEARERGTCPPCARYGRI